MTDPLTTALRDIETVHANFTLNGSTLVAMAVASLAKDFTV